MVERSKKTGNSAAVVPDQPSIEACHLGAGSPVEVSTDGCETVSVPVPDTMRTARIREISEEIEHEHGEVFRRLRE